MYFKNLKYSEGASGHVDKSLSFISSIKLNESWYSYISYGLISTAIFFQHHVN